MKKALSVILALCLLAALPLRGWAAPKDTTPHWAIEVWFTLENAAGKDEAALEEQRLGYTAADFLPLDVARAIPVRRAQTLISSSVLNGGEDVSPFVYAPIEDVKDAPTGHYMLILNDPSKGNAEAAAAYLNGFGGGKPVTGDMTAQERRFTEMCPTAYTVYYEGADIYALETFMLKVRLPADKKPQSLFAEPDAVNALQLGPAWARTCAVWPKEADYDFACGLLTRLLAANLIDAGSVISTWELSTEMDAENRLIGPRYAFTGDPDCDARLTAADARAALRMAVGLEPTDLTADQNGDGAVTAEDARFLLRAAVKLEPLAENVGLPLQTSGMAVLGPFTEMTDSGYEVYCTAPETDALTVETVRMDPGLPGFVGGIKLVYFVCRTKTPGDYRVTVSTGRRREATPTITLTADICAR